MPLPVLTSAPDPASVSASVLSAAKLSWNVDALLTVPVPTAPPFVATSVPADIVVPPL